MTINFPNSPSLNQLYTYDNKTWEWNGVYWEVYSALTSYITSAYTVGNGFSDISGVTGGNIVLKSFSGVNINIIDSGNKLTFSGQSTSGFTLGTGTTNNLPKWITSNSLGDSIVSDNGNRMTVNGDSVIDNRYLGSRGGDESFLFYGYRAGEGVDINYSNNIGIGSGVLKNSVGNNNIAIGLGLSEYFTENNILIGFNSFNINSSGQYNIIIGNDSFQNNDSGTDNIAIGTNNLVNNISGNNNIAIGRESLLSNDTGYENISIGAQSLVNNLDGLRNIAIGTSALGNNINGRQNIAIGTNLNSVTTGRRNIALGDDSLKNADNDDNIGIGVSSLYSIDSRSAYNISIGTSSLYSNQRGSRNVSIGYESGYNNNGEGNIFIGYRSAYDFTSSKRLYINNDSGIPLVYGEFDNKRFGINITAATNTLHVSGATNPLRLEGLQLSANTRYLVANDQGVVTFVTGVTSEKSFTNVAINGTTQLSASTTQILNFSGINLSITTASTNTLVFSSSSVSDRINIDSIFGGGEDGDLNLTSTTLTLTRDSFYNNIILNSDSIITTSNWRLFCRTLTFKGKSFVRNNGQDGSTAPSGSGGGSGTGASAGGFLAAGQSGTAGAAGVAQSNGAQSTVVANLALSPHSNVSGPSGKGGNTALRTGGIAGATNLVTNIKYISTIPFVDTLLRVTTQVNGGAGGRGGSSGASDVVGTAGRGGGGGGGGAGAVVVFAETIDVGSATAPVFTAIGGSGGSGASSSVVDIAGGGGGSGGSGGYIIIVYKEIIGSLLNAINASGGDGGNGGSGGVSGAAITGGNGGGSGGGGRIVLINVLTGVVTHVIGGNGVAGSAATGTAGAARATATPVTANL